MLGIGVLLLASLSWAIGSLYNRGANLPASPLLGTGMEMLAGSAGLFILGTLSGEWNQLDICAVSTQSWLGFIYLIVFGSWVGFVSYIWLLRVAPTMLVSTYAYVNPLVAILLGSLFAGEVLTPRILLATIAILGSVAVITYTQQASPRAGSSSTAVSPSGKD
jgi:drug/metabolite transporter (DMT)-like permease